MKIITFKQLNSWKSAHKLTLTIYETTHTFPETEKFGLTSQIRRASISVESNIAEGFARINQKEKRQFYYMSLSSLSEVECQLEITKDLKYINQKQYQLLENQIRITRKLISGLVRSINNK